MTFWVGTSGWSYDHWDDVLYPPGLPAARRLQHYTAEFRTVELNASFYRWPRTAAFAGWRRRLPEGFRMTVKAPRGLTHGRRLYSPEQWVERITAGLHELGDRRGPPLFACRLLAGELLVLLFLGGQLALALFEGVIGFGHKGARRSDK